MGGEGGWSLVFRVGRCGLIPPLIYYHQKPVPPTLHGHMSIFSSWGGVTSCEVTIQTMAQAAFVDPFSGGQCIRGYLLDGLAGVRTEVLVSFHFNAQCLTS